MVPSSNTTNRKALLVLKTVANEREDRYVFFEGVMRRVLVSSGTLALRLVAGKHTVVIWAPDSTKGRFMFGFGVEENFDDGGGGGFGTQNKRETAIYIIYT